jgi:ribosomal protein S17E
MAKTTLVIPNNSHHQGLWNNVVEHEWQRKLDADFLTQERIVHSFARAKKVAKFVQNAIAGIFIADLARQ